MSLQGLTLGAIPLGAGRCVFRVWAPGAERVEVHLLTPADRLVPMRKDERGYHVAQAEQVPAGADYRFRVEGAAERPDPASRWQPQGVHGPSRVVEPQFAWTDAGWAGLRLREYVFYELHVGVFSGEGTFEGVIGHLPALRELGVTAIELMPVAQFPGSRNWGYDGVYPYAVQESYGGPVGLKRLVDAAHRHGLAVVLDVVYNHLGPEGNYLGEFGPYFTDRYRTPWGPAVNLDGPHSDEVRRYFIENALYWQTEFHIDALRLDAVHAIRDFSAVPFLEELAGACHRQAGALRRRFHLIAESDLNMARHILPRALGGYGLDAQWSDDFHHALHVLLTGEQNGYYADFGGVAPLAKAWREGYAFTGEYSRYRRRRHGSSPRANPVTQFVVCGQNHDQVGNRVRGDRLGATLSFERQKLAAAAVLLSPFVPLLFMGEEYGETAPFQYFVSHSEPALIEAVRRGRREEFAAFAWEGDVPDPQDEATFERCRLNHALAGREPHRTLRAFYRELLMLRREVRAIGGVEKETLESAAWGSEGVMGVRQWNGGDEVLLVFNFGGAPGARHWPFPAGAWRKRLDSADRRWAGPGSPAAADVVSSGCVLLELPATVCVVYQRCVVS
ncbi:MAG: malto-oligosyltrehalose trehalohydrolase [Verrucomicrobia bacterium]|nr:malto-oligosyltrehalose trehalohydrolase [Verrucomicrobiota bacterium]